MNKLTLEDKEKFDKVYGSLKVPLGDNNFASVYLLSQCYKDVEWSEINGNLCLFLTFEGRRSVWGPVLPGYDIQDTLRKCFSICENFSVNRNLKKKPGVKYIPEELKTAYSKLNGFKLKSQNRDYIYRVKDLIELKGRKYKDKRNKRNYFLKNHKFKVEEYLKERHMEGCKNLLQKWKKQKINGLKANFLEKLDAEADANLKALDFADYLGIKGVVVLINDNVEGFIFGQKVSDDLCIMLHGKTNLQIKGLSQFICGDFLKTFFPDCEMVNDMEDWDVDYLANSKRSYAPYMMNRSYMLIEDERF